MNLFTHAVLAKHLQPLVNPKNPAEYLWGSVIPDIRYLARMRRKTTHLRDDEIVAWFSRYPALESFIQGYRVHCMLDQIDTVQVIGNAFPFSLLPSLLRRRFSSQQMAVVIELYYHKVFPEGLVLSGEHNQILEDLGIQAGHTVLYAAADADYFACPSYETAAASFARLGIIDDTRIEKYMKAYQRIQGNPLLRWALMTSAKNARLEQKATDLLFLQEPVQK